MLAHDKILCSVLCCYSLLLLHITSIRWRRLRPFGLLVLNGFSLWRFASFIFFFFKGVPCGSLVGFMGPLSKCLLLFYPRGDCFLFTPLACMCTRHPDEDINCQNWHHPPLLPLPLVSCPEVHKGLGPSFGSPALLPGPPSPGRNSSCYCKGPSSCSPLLLCSETPVEMRRHSVALVFREILICSLFSKKGTNQNGEYYDIKNACHENH